MEQDGGKLNLLGGNMDTPLLTESSRDTNDQCFAFDRFSQVDLVSR